MRKNLFPLIVTVILISMIALVWVKLENAAAFAASFMVVLIYVAALWTYSDLQQERRSLENPYRISENDAGKVLRVASLRDDRIGLVPWGHRDFALQDLQSYVDYYQISGIPRELRNVGDIFKIEMTSKSLVFKKVKVNGFADRSKLPFEVLEQAYC